MSDIEVKTEGDRIGWQSDMPIWADFSGNPKCHLCNEKPGTVYRKGHTRRNGIHLENSLMFCQDCSKNRAVECDKDWETWWAEQWAKCEARAEKNWQEHGIYTNVGGDDKGLSTYFGYVKMPDGTFRPYRYEHPENKRDIFERDYDDEMTRLHNLDCSDDEKFESLLKFLKEYPSDKEIDHQLAHEIKRVEEYQKKREEVDED